MVWLARCQTYIQPSSRTSASPKRIGPPRPRAFKRPNWFCLAHSATVAVMKPNTSPKNTVLNRATARLWLACLTRPSRWPKNGRHVSQHQNRASKTTGTTNLMWWRSSNGTVVVADKAETMTIRDLLRVERRAADVQIGLISLARGGRHGRGRRDRTAREQQPQHDRRPRCGRMRPPDLPTLNDADGDEDEKHDQDGEALLGSRADAHDPGRTLQFAGWSEIDVEASHRHRSDDQRKRK